ncbi:cardiolipin synthase [Oribacterium sp. NK2B42]|uniref:cardiolipin synthase n=1 Tax=Oribacterium sp. NK2B42 TaxID=689781 RepID=UPI0005D21C74
MNNNNDEQQTYEGRKETHNGIKRMVFVGIALLIEILIVLLLFTKLWDYAEWINIGMRILALVLVLGIYAQNKTAAMKMPWIILILVLPIMGVSLYLLIGLNGYTRKMRDRYRRIDEVLMPILPKNTEVYEKLKETDRAAAGISHYIATNALYPVYQNTLIKYYDSAADGLEAQLTALAKAKTFIFMEYHAIDDSVSWNRIEEVLAEKVKQGVEVRVFYDDMGSIGFINMDFCKKLEARGIKCRVFNPLAPGFNAFLNNRDHRKITVVDGYVGFTGGYNLADEYFGLKHPFGLWKDTGIRLEGEAVRSLTVTFLEMWNAVSDEDKDDVEFGRFFPEDATVAGENAFIQPYADSPMDDIHVGEDVYISIVEKAVKYCYFVTPYLIITDEMAHAMALAAERGVDVRVITPGIPDKKMVYNVTRSFYNSLARHGVRMYEWTPGFCHAKMCVADDVMATCGTINLDYRSLYHHFENGCFIAHSEVVPAIRRDFEKMFSESTEVTEEYSTVKSSYLKLSQLFLRLFAELM